MAINGNQNTDYYNQQSATVGGHMTAPEITEELFRAIDAIVTKRLESFTFDKTVEGKIISVENSTKGEYKVTGDNNVTFTAYSDNPNLVIGQKIYVRIPENDYTKRKVITGLYEPVITTNSSNNDVDIVSISKKITQAEFEVKIQELKDTLIEKLLEFNQDNSLTDEERKAKKQEITFWYIKEADKLQKAYAWGT